MKQKLLSKSLYIPLFVLLLLVALAAPALAQDPEADEAVEAQVVGFVNFYWDPAAALVARGDGSVRTTLNVQGAEQISGMTLAVGYNASIVSPQNVIEGGLLPGTEGVDYFMTVRTGGGALACGGDSSFTVNISYLNPTLTINGTGSLIDVLWRSDPDAAVGNIATVCLDSATSQVVDNGGFPGPVVPNTLATIQVEPATLFKFRIGLEGGKNSGLAVVAVPDNIFTDVTIDSIYPCDGGSVDFLGYCEFSNATTLPTYSVVVKRIGYLDVNATFDKGGPSSSVVMVAGDLNQDNKINILDLHLMASFLGSPAGASTLSQAADYTGPGTPPAPSGVIDIIDLVLVAKNFGKTGPTDGTPPSGSFPF